MGGSSRWRASPSLSLLGALSDSRGRLLHEVDVSWSFLKKLKRWTSRCLVVLDFPRRRAAGGLTLMLKKILKRKEEGAWTSRSKRMKSWRMRWQVRSLTVWRLSTVRRLPPREEK